MNCVHVHELCNRTGTAAQIRSQVSAAFSAGGNGDRLSAASLLASSSANTILGPSLGNTALSVPSYGGVSESGRTLVSARGCGN